MPRKPTRDELDAELEHIMRINETENDMETTHTPGYWDGTHGIVRAGESPGYVPIFRHSDGGTKTICLVQGNGPARDNETLANARLIAAAPSLLEALKDALEEIREWRRWARPGDGPTKPIVTSSVIERAAFVIAKAEGRE